MEVSVEFAGITLVIPLTGVRRTQLRELAFLEVSIMLVLSGNCNVCVCSIEPDALRVRICIGFLVLAGTISIRYQLGRVKIHRLFMIIPLAAVLSRMISPELNNGEVVNIPVAVVGVEFLSIKTGPSPGLTLNK